MHVAIATRVLDALDALALALAEHDHQWTIDERRMYEQAVAYLRTELAKPED